LRIETEQPARVRWSHDQWKTVQDADSVNSGIGLFVTDLPTRSVPTQSQIVFTFFWPAGDRWEGADFSLKIAGVRKGNSDVDRSK
jgi:glucoamylase